MNKIIAISLVLAAGAAGAAYIGLVPIWGYIVAVVLSIGSVGSLFFKKDKVKIIESIVPVERERVKTKKEQIKNLKLAEKDNSSKSKEQKVGRIEELETNRKSDVDLDAVRAKLKSIRSGEASDRH